MEWCRELGLGGGGAKPPYKPHVQQFYTILEINIITGAALKYLFIPHTI